MNSKAEKSGNSSKQPALSQQTHHHQTQTAMNSNPLSHHSIYDQQPFSYNYYQPPVHMPPMLPGNYPPGSAGLPIGFSFNLPPLNTTHHFPPPMPHSGYHYDPQNMDRFPMYTSSLGNNPTTSSSHPPLPIPITTSSGNQNNNQDLGAVEKTGDGNDIEDDDDKAGGKKRRTNYRRPENAAKLNAAVNALIMQKQDPNAPKDIRSVSKIFNIPYNTLRDNYLRVTTGDVRTTKRQRKKEEGEQEGNDFFETSLDQEQHGFPAFDEVSHEDHESKPKPSKTRKVTGSSSSDNK